MLLGGDYSPTFDFDAVPEGPDMAHGREHPDLADASASRDRYVDPSALDYEPGDDCEYCEIAMLHHELFDGEKLLMCREWRQAQMEDE